MMRRSGATRRKAGAAFADRTPGDGKRNSMDRLVIRGGRRIEGSVQICGAKNAALPQIAAALLSFERLELGNVPEVTDVTTMLAMMQEFGVVATRGPGRMLVLDASGARNAQAVSYTHLRAHETVLDLV